MATDTHITFIHGLANKPSPIELRRTWLKALSEPGNDTHGFSPESEGISVSFVYWADLFYDSPIPPGEYENIQDEWQAKLPATIELASDAWMLAMQKRFPIDQEDAYPEPTTTSTTPIYERVPLPWPIKKMIIKEFLREAHDYLFNVNGIRDEIRKRVLDDLNIFRGRHHILAGHSQGSFIAYDVLTGVAGCKEIAGLLTLGSPLGIDEVQDKLIWSRENGFPNKLTGDWFNVFDPLDLVARPDPRLANDFRRDGKEMVKDIEESNWGTWRHSATKYLKGPKLRSVLRKLCNRERD